MTAEPFAGLTLARLLRPWGRRGQLAAEVLTDFPERLFTLRKAHLFDGRNPAYPIGIRSCRLHLGQAIFQFEGVDSINDAERLRGLEVQVPASERVVLTPGRFYIVDLVGCEVWENSASGSASGAGAATRLGTVREVQRSAEFGRDTTPEAWMLAVDTSSGEVLVPFAAAICTKIDISARRIEVTLPEGLRELNQSAPQNPPVESSERGPV